MKLVTVSQMQAVEKEADAGGLTYDMMMENAGQGLADVILDLGGSAAAVVLADWSSEADLDWAAARIATFANYQAGQSCISVQRAIVKELRCPSPGASS